MSMSFRHAAALALVGWWVVVPPISRGWYADLKAPIRGWTKVEPQGGVDTEAACEKTLSDHKYLASALGDSGYALSTDLQNELIRHAQCVDEHDPRLRGWKGAFIGLIS